MEEAPDLPFKCYYVNKRQTWMRRKKELSLSDILSRLHLQESTNPPDQEDRISKLPEEVLHHILSLMPIEMAIRTSVLSKAWRHRWKHTRVVDFHNLRFSIFKANCTPINRSLDLIESPDIESFTVVGLVGDRSHPDLKKWVDFALSRKVRTLRIGLLSISNPIIVFKLPKSLFTKNQTRTLEVLFLSCVDYRPPRGVIFSASGFASLKTLAFTKCTLADSTVDMFLRKCLFLEVLVLDMCFELVKINISGSNLKLKQLTFKWDDSHGSKDELLEVDAPGLITLIYSGELTKILLKNCQGLEKIILLGKRERPNEAYYNHTRELINQITQVKTLGVNSLFLEFVAKEYYHWDDPFLEFQNLKHLFWCDTLWTVFDVYYLVGFLVDCPSLEDCVIDFRTNCWAAFCDTTHDLGWVNNVKVEVAEDLLPHGRCMEKLKSIRVICFSGLFREMRLVRLLLEKAVKLQKLELFWRNDVSTMTNNVLQIIYTSDDTEKLVAKVEEDSNCIEEMVNTFPKSSRNARIVYRKDWEFREWYNIFGV